MERSTPASRRPAFTIIELLVVVSIIALLIALLMPALHAARNIGKAICCASHLRQIGTAVGAYVADHDQHLPYIDSALWDPTSPTRQNWDADPTDASQHPHSFTNVLGDYLMGVTLMRCPDAVAGYPADDPVVTYRIASADNVDAVPETVEQLRRPGGGVAYEYPFKYFNGRPYEVETIEGKVGQSGNGFPTLTWKVKPERGEYYLVRDFVDDVNGQRLIPHQGDANQLFIDLSVQVFREDGEGGHIFTDDRRGN